VTASTTTKPPRADTYALVVEILETVRGLRPGGAPDELAPAVRAEFMDFLAFAMGMCGLLMTHGNLSGSQLVAVKAVYLRGRRLAEEMGGTRLALIQGRVMARDVWKKGLRQTDLLKPDTPVDQEGLPPVADGEIPF
jgi:hypothetical protein